MEDLPIQTLMYRLRGKYPSLGVSLDAPDSPVGAWFLDIDASPRITVQWHPSHGFGCSIAGEGYGEKPEEVYHAIDAVLGRVVSLIAPTAKSPLDPLPHHEPVTLAELRKSILRVNQVELSDRMGIKQATVSSMERGGDPKVRSVRQYVEALGGELHLIALVNGQSIPIRIGGNESNA